IFPSSLFGLTLCSSYWFVFVRPDRRPSYLVLSPRILRSGVPMSVSVTVLIDGDVYVSARIVRGNQTLAANSSTVEGGTSSFVIQMLNKIPHRSPCCDLQIYEDESGYKRSFTLEVQGHVGNVQVFSDATRLQFDLKGFSIFIQTDKLNYLPGQAVKIRVVSINPDGRPHISPMDNPRGYLIRQWLAADSVLGVISKEFDLSDNPPLGVWSITATGQVSLLCLTKSTQCVPYKGLFELWKNSSETLVDVGCNAILSATRLSGLTHNSSVKVSVAKSRYKLSFEEYPRILKPSLSFTAKVRKATFLFEFCRVFQIKKMHFFIRINFKWSYVCILCVKVKSRGQVVSAGTGIHAANLTLVPEVSWAPLACIIVYCVHPTGEIVNDAIDVPITPVLQNKVSLSWSKTMTRPAEDVTLNVSVAEPNSLVGILVVDKATRLAGSHNDITTETVRITALNGIFPTFVTSNLAVEHQEEQQEPHERQNFPETWIWMDANTGDSNTKEIPLTVPDSITSWTATAFVMSESLGLGFVDQPAKLTVFQDFFLSLNLPACIIRGEELVLEVILFNYLQQQLEVSVIVAQSDTFEFVFPDSEELPMPTVREVRVESESGTTVLIPIRPLIIGEIPISVKATSSAASDFVRTTVLVKAEGLEQLFSKSLLLELSPSESNISRNIVFTFPPDTVEDSQRVMVTAVGDILGPSISGLDSLIRMPYGCGEQNMINFAPNIYVLQYLNASGQADQNTVDRATEFMMKGYVRELSFQRLDGSFSAFGDRDSSGSTWLSAFVLRCFLQARPFISIDSQVLDTAAAWIAARQAADGSFREPGRVIHTELQGGLDGPVSLTAYVLIALLEDSDIRVSAALMYLEARLALGVSSSYSLSLLTYALALDGSSNAQTALNNLLGRAETIDGGLEWPSTHGGVSSSWQPRSADIEMVSYVLLTLHRLGLVSQGLGLMKWLSQQRNDRGGFGSTQDTVVALQALATYAALGGSKDTDISIRVNINTVNTVASFHINQENYLLHQNFSSPLINSCVLLPQLNVFYNIRNEELRRRRRHAGEREPFELYVSLTDEEMDSTHLSRDLGLNMTGMAIMEVGLLSGFSLTPDAIQTDQVIKKVETQPGKVILYLDSVSCTQTRCTECDCCLSVRRRTETTYKSWWRREMAACSFCGDGCSQCRADQQQEVSAAPSSRLHLLPAVLLLFVIFGM
uniref:CD109 molecule n=1 Tax=Amphiprion percula TaxID=161767 RepID=A0A3P8TCL5_AMPPE